MYNLSNKIYVISGSRGAGKTMLSTILAGESYEVIASNYDITKTKETPHKLFRITNINDLSSFLDSRINLLKQHGYVKKSVIIIDEAQILFNRKMSMSKVNRKGKNFSVLSRKGNVDMFLLLQDWQQLDKEILYQCSYSIQVLGEYAEDFYNVNTGKLDKHIKYKVQQKSSHGTFYTIKLKSHIIGALEKLGKIGLTYNTTDTAELET